MKLRSPPKPPISFDKVFCVSCWVPVMSLFLADWLRDNWLTDTQQANTQCHWNFVTPSFLITPWWRWGEEMMYRVSWSVLVKQNPISSLQIGWAVFLVCPGPLLFPLDWFLLGGDHSLEWHYLLSYESPVGWFYDNFKFVSYHESDRPVKIHHANLQDPLNNPPIPMHIFSTNNNPPMFKTIVRKLWQFKLSSTRKCNLYTSILSQFKFIYMYMFFSNCKIKKFMISKWCGFGFLFFWGFLTNQNQSTNRSADGHNSLPVIVKYTSLSLFTGLQTSQWWNCKSFIF